MENRFARFFALGSLAAAAGLCASEVARAQSTYGLAARATIPYVIATNPASAHGYRWHTHVEVHNPHLAPIDVAATYFGATGTSLPGRQTCQTLRIDPGTTASVALRALCGLPPGNYAGRLELRASGAPDPTTGAPAYDPSATTFLSKALVFRDNHAPSPHPQAPLPGPRDGDQATIEGIPQGLLSGNKGFAAVTGLKQGQMFGSAWRSVCLASALNEATAAFVHLKDGNTGLPIGNFASMALDPSQSMEMAQFGGIGVDVFSAVGAPPGSYENVTAYFSTTVQGTESGSGVLASCWLVNDTAAERSFAVAKYLDNNDDGREFRTSIGQTAFRRPFSVITGLDPTDVYGTSNLHVGYFQHPDRVSCRVDFGSSPHLASFDQVQIRLIDPDGQLAAGGPLATEFSLDLGEKSTRNSGRNGRWLIEVAPYHAFIQYPDSNGVYTGGVEITPYTLTCASGNGHNQLDIVGHCRMQCQSYGGGGPDVKCDFESSFIRDRCWY